MCQPCGIYFQSIALLEDHWANATTVHVYCRKCNLHFKDKDERWDHWRDLNCHAICGWCTQLPEFGTEIDLRKHWLNDHRDTFCSLCCDDFETPSELQMHALEFHRFCDWCSLSFSAPEDLRRHFKTSVRHLFTFCHNCEENFDDPADLRRVWLRSCLLIISLTYLTINSI